MHTIFLARFAASPARLFPEATTGKISYRLKNALAARCSGESPDSWASYKRYQYMPSIEK